VRKVARKVVPKTYGGTQGRPATGEVRGLQQGLEVALEVKFGAAGANCCRWFKPSSASMCARRAASTPDAQTLADVRVLLQ